MQKVILIVVGILIVLLALGTCKGNSGSKNDGDYMLYCQKMIKKNATNPETVDFQNTKVRIESRDDGVTVVLPFSAKNAFGVPRSYVANCTMKNDGTNQQIFIH